MLLTKDVLKNEIIKMEILPKRILYPTDKGNLVRTKRVLELFMVNNGTAIIAVETKTRSNPTAGFFNASVRENSRPSKTKNPHESNGKMPLTTFMDMESILPGLTNTAALHRIMRKTA